MNKIHFHFHFPVGQTNITFTYTTGPHQQQLKKQSYIYEHIKLYQQKVNVPSHFNEEISFNLKPKQNRLFLHFVDTNNQFLSVIFW